MISLQTIPTYMVAGYYLAFFFSLSHNFEGVHMQSDTTRPSNKGSMEHSFLYKQVRVIKRIQDSSTKNFTEHNEQKVENNQTNCQISKKCPPRLPHPPTWADRGSCT